VGEDEAVSLYVVMKLGTFLVGPGQLVREWRECQLRDTLERAVEFCERKQRLAAERGDEVPALYVAHEGRKVWP
jgi:hypothetical protein